MIRHDHDSPGQLISHPDFVDIEIPHAAGAASSRKPTPRSGVRIVTVSMQVSNTATGHVLGVVRVWSP